MKKLVIYFSRGGENFGVGNCQKGNTEVVAEYIKHYTGADMFCCRPQQPYSQNYDECCQQALALQQQDARPELQQYLDDISQYDVIFIGGPVYWGEYPYDLYSQLDKLNFEGKIVKPFTTHEGSGLANCVAVLQNKCKGAKICSGLAIQGRYAATDSSKKKVKDWVRKYE